MCMHIHICTGIHLCAYILVHVHACMSRPEVGIQYLPGPFSTWHIETGSLTWTQNSLISSSPWPVCCRNPISASRTQGLLVGYHAYPESIRVPRIQSSWVLYLVSHLPISKLLYLLEVNSVKMDKALCVVSLVSMGHGSKHSVKNGNHNEHVQMFFLPLFCRQ